MYKVIKSEHEYRVTLDEIERLIDLEPEIGSAESDTLELLTLLVQNYELEHHAVMPPDPIEAILFRMEQQNLTQRDLIPYIGHRNRVSDVLTRKRPLTLAMIQALHSGLGVPATILIKNSTTTNDESNDLEWHRFPLKEMQARGWFGAALTRTAADAEILLRSFFAPIGIERVASALYRRTRHLRTGRRMDDYALAAWSARIVSLAISSPPTTKYVPGSITPDVLRQLVKLSVHEDGPKQAQKFLLDYGICLIIEPQLQHTYVDGVALLAKPDLPVIGLTLRFDRIDNFWYCLIHELAHIVLHLSSTGAETEYYDDLEVDAEDSIEQEADDMAGEILIPQVEWKKSAARWMPTPEAAQMLANKLQIHSAIVAGRIRHELKAYRLLNNLIGHNMVRQNFPEVKWG